MYISDTVSSFDIPLFYCFVFLFFFFWMALIPYSSEFFIKNLGQMSTLLLNLACHPREVMFLYLMLTSMNLNLKYNASCYPMVLFYVFVFSLL